MSILLADGGFWDWVLGNLEDGGPFMIPLGICAIAAVVVAIRRVLALRQKNVIPRFVRAALITLPEGTDTGHLWQLVDGNSAALARITRMALLHLDQSRAENADAVQTAARREIMRLEKGLGTLELIVGISPSLASWARFPASSACSRTSALAKPPKTPPASRWESPKPSTPRSSAWRSRSRL